MKRNHFCKMMCIIAGSVALGILIQIFLPDILIIAICCILVIIMGIVVAKFT